MCRTLCITKRPLRNDKMNVDMTKTQSGASMIETMVALLILAIGTLGVMAMQVNAMKFNQNAYLYTQAAVIAEEIGEVMRSVAPEARDHLAKKDAVSTNAPADTISTIGGCGSQDTENAFIDCYVGEWTANVSVLLPKGGFDIKQGGNDGTEWYQIVVSFDQASIEDLISTADDGGAGDGDGDDADGDDDESSVTRTDYVLDVRF